MNRLYYGDCLTILREMGKYSVDLIYLDPPFNSNREYNAIYKDETGRQLPDQIEAFNDTWTLDAERERAIRYMPVLLREAGVDDDVASFWRLWMNALRTTNPRLLAYLSYMVERLVYMKPILKPTGSIYLHCDTTASHYIKVMMDGIFGHTNFRSEIIWKRTYAHGGAKRWGPVHDTILFYTVGASYTWNRVYQPYDPTYVEKYYRLTNRGRRYQLVSLTGPGVRDQDSGKPWRGVDPTVSGRHWAVPRNVLMTVAEGRDTATMSTQDKLDVLDDAGLIYWPPGGGVPRQKRYLDEAPGSVIQDMITDIGPEDGKDRLGYATQKPLKLLDRIIRASSNPGDTVLDPFCGCATTLEAAHTLDRRWIGIDIAIHAIKRVARVRLEERLGLKEGTHFTIEGVPRNAEGALDLWKRDSYHFQKWAVECVDGFVTKRKTGDGGIDGRIYFGVYGEKELRSMAIEVKGGKHVGIGVLRALRGVLEDDQALMAGLVVMNPPNPRQAASFGRFMAAAGELEVLGRKYPRMQLLTVQEILDGKRFDTPSVVGRGSPQTDLGVG